MNADSSQLYGAVTSLWTIVAGVVLSFLVVPATVYYLLVVRTAAAPGGRPSASRAESRWYRDW